jgi:hypothetical protein
MILAVIQSSLVLLVALCAVGIFRRQSAATRHAILTAGLIGSLTAPFWGVLLPDSRLIRSSSLYVVAYEPGEVFWKLDAGEQTEGDRASAPVRVSRSLLLWIWIIGAAVAGTFLIAGLARIGWLVYRSPAVSLRWL